jgi:fucose permease
MGLVNAALGPTLPALAAQTGSALASLGVLFSARSLGYLLMLHPAGLGFDRRPGHGWLGGALLAIAACMLATPFAPLLWLLVALHLVVGAGEGVLDLAGNTLLSRLHGARAPAFLNALHFFYALGALLAPLGVAASLALGQGIVGAYGALAGLLLAVALGLLALRAPPAVPLPGQGRTVSAHTEPPPGPRGASGREPGRESGHRLLVVLLSALLLLAVGAEVSLGGWWASYALRLGLTDAPGAALLTSVYWSGFAAGRLTGIPLASRWPPRRVLALHLPVALVAVLAVAALPGLAWVGAALAGWGIGPAYATAVAFAGRRVPMSGRVASRLFAGAALGSMTLPWIAGQVLVRLGGAALLLWVAALLLGALAAVAAVLRHDARRAPTA